MGGVRRRLLILDYGMCEETWLDNVVQYVIEYSARVGFGFGTANEYPAPPESSGARGRENHLTGAHSPSCAPVNFGHPLYSCSPLRLCGNDPLKS